LKILCEDCQTEHDDSLPCPICEPMARALQAARRNRRIAKSWPGERLRRHKPVAAPADCRSPHNDD